MKYAIAAGIVAVMVFSSLPAQADQIDCSKLTCSQFMALSKKMKSGTTMIWLEGYYTSQDASPILDTDKISTDGTNLANYCVKNPDSGFIDAASMPSSKPRTDPAASRDLAVDAPARVGGLGRAYWVDLVVLRSNRKGHVAAG